MAALTWAQQNAINAKKRQAYNESIGNPQGSAFGTGSSKKSSGGTPSPYPQQVARQTAPMQQTPRPAAPQPQQYAPPPQQYAPQPQMPYQPGNPAATGVANRMSKYGEGLLDPNSELSRRMQEIMTGRIGEETGAAKRLAAFQASQSGMGAGGSPELSAMLSDIDIEGMETGGRASADLMARMPGMGLDFLKPAAQTHLGVGSEALSGYLGQQQLNQQQQQAAANSYYTGRGLDLQQQQLDQDALFNQFALMFQ
jgi:hypothetical protein